MGRRQPEGPGVAKGQSLKGNLQADTWRGKPRARSWPTPRGPSKNAANKACTAWFKDALAMIKRMEPGHHLFCMEQTKGTPLMPRDLAMMMMNGRFLTLQDQDGNRIYSEVIMTNVSRSLDAISQVEGAILYRSKDYWWYIPPGEENQILTVVDANGTPEWRPNTGGGAAHIGRYGCENIWYQNGATFLADNYGALLYTSPATFNSDGIFAYWRADYPALQVTPAVYAYTPAQTIGPVLATGPTKVGVTKGENFFPFTALLSVLPGQQLMIGIRCHNGNSDMAQSVGTFDLAFSAVSGLPVLGQGASGSGANAWSNFQLRVAADV